MERVQQWGGVDLFCLPPWVLSGGLRDLEHLTVCWAQVGFVHAEDHFWSDEEEKHTGYGRAYKSVSLG